MGKSRRTDEIHRDHIEMQNLFVLRVGDVTMNIANCHIYGNQIEQAKIQVQRTPFNPPKIEGIFEGSKSKGLTMDDILHHPDPLRDVRVLEYMHWEPIKYEFTV